MARADNNDNIHIFEPSVLGTRIMPGAMPTSTICMIKIQILPDPTLLFNALKGVYASWPGYVSGITITS